MAKTSLGSRVLSVLLAASMVASLNAPVSAWAAGDDATGAAAAVDRIQHSGPAGIPGIEARYRQYRSHSVRKLQAGVL